MALGGGMSPTLKKTLGRELMFEQSSSTFETISYLIDVIFLFDILVQFRSAYDQDGYTVVETLQPKLALLKGQTYTSASLAVAVDAVLGRALSVGALHWQV